MEVTTNARLVKTGSSEPCALVKIISLAVFDDEEKNKDHSSVFLDFFNKELGLQDERYNLFFIH